MGGSPPKGGSPSMLLFERYNPKHHYMPTPEKLKAPFLPGAFYHLVCKSVDGILLFYQEKDHEVYLERFKKFLGDFVSTWSYSLLSNHTHYICKIKSVELITVFLEILPEKEKTKSMLQWERQKSNLDLFDEMLERQMNRFLVSYANYLNNKYERRGSVFQSPFKRLQINGEEYLQQAVIYVHANVQKHGVISDYKEHFHSSFNNIMKDDSYYADVNNVLDFFKGKEQFLKIHEEQVAYFYSRGWPSSKLE